MALPFLLLAIDNGRVVPKKFFVVMPFGSDEYSANKTKDIAAGVLDGVLGISDKAEIIMQWYGMARDVILAMDGPELVRLNSLSRVQYDNPEYLVSNGLAALYRLFAKNPAAKYSANALANNVSDNIAAGLKKASTSISLEKEAKDVSDLLIKASVALNTAMETLPSDSYDKKYLLLQAEIDQGDLDFLDGRLRKAAEYVDSFMQNTKTSISQRDIDLYLDPSDFVIGSFVGFDDNKERFLTKAYDYGFDNDDLASFQNLLDAVSIAVDAFDARNELGDKAADFVSRQKTYGGLLYAAQRGDLRKVVEEAFTNGTKDIKTVKGLVKVIADAAKNSYGLRDLSLADWEAIVRQGLRHIGEVYSDEGEWLVKDRKLKIPPKSTLWISKYPLPEDVEARRKAGETTKLDEFVHESHIKGNNDMDRLIKDFNLEQKYIVRRIDKKRFDEARSKWIVKPKKLAASVEKAPKEFRLLFHLPNERIPDLGDQLAKGVLKGISGITDAGPVLQLRMLTVNRNAMLIMPGPQTMQLNDLRPIKYSDPESLVADDMAIAQRIMGRDFDKRKVITRILQEAEKGPMKEWTRAWQRLESFPEEQMASRPVNSVRDLAEHMFELSKPKVEAAIENNKEWVSEEWINERYQPLLNVENYVKAIRSGLRGLGKGFVWEGEWLVADKTLRIPEGSRLIVLNKKPEARKMVEDYSLDQRYRVQYADQKKMEQATFNLGKQADKATKERWSEGAVSSKALDFSAPVAIMPRMKKKSSRKLRANTPLSFAEAKDAMAEAAQKSAAEGIPIALGGGFAMQAYGSDRLTQDVDLIAPKLPSFAADGDDLIFGGKSVDINGIPIDVIVRADDYADLYEEAIQKAKSRPGYEVKIITPEYLVAMKMVAGRPKDDLDLNYLLSSVKMDMTTLKSVVSRFLGRYAVSDLASRMQEAKWMKKAGKL